MPLQTIKNPVLYSTMTLAAYNINSTYYDNKHYMWCTPYFGSNYTSPHFTVPPSSSPLEIYTTLSKEIIGGDLHGGKIKLNRLGIRKGADHMLKMGRITKAAWEEIIVISKKAPVQQFQPLLCVIPRIEAVPFAHKVAIKDKANPLAHEFIVADLPQSAFDIIRIG
jgi:hypothetical protein